MLGIANKLLKTNFFWFLKFVDITLQYVALLPQVNFPANNLNFHWRWRWLDQIQAIFLNLFYFKWNQANSSKSEGLNIYFSILLYDGKPGLLLSKHKNSKICQILLFFDGKTWPFIPKHKNINNGNKRRYHFGNSD